MEFRRVLFRSEIERADGRWTRVREEETANGGLFLTVTDITETKTIERAEREIRDRLRAVIDHLPAGLVLKDEHGVHLLANQQVLELYGLQGREVVGTTARDPFPPQQRSEEHTSELQSLMRISYAVFCLKKNKYLMRPITTH